MGRSGASGTVILLALWCSVSQSPAMLAEPPRGSSVIVLVDFSASFSPLRGTKADVVRRIATALEKLAVSLPNPVMIQWLGIGSSSPLDEPPCGGPVEYIGRMVPSHKPNQISRPDDLRLRLDECVRAVLQRSEKADNFTDISGAVAVAAETAQTGFDTRVLIIMSDFREDRPHGEPSIQYKLHGERVAMIHRPEERDRPDMRGY